MSITKITEMNEERYKSLEMSLHYFSDLTAMTSEILRGVPIAEACRKHNVTMQSYRNILGREHLGWPTHTFSAKEFREMLSWQERLWLDVMGETDPTLIPYDIDSTVNYILHETGLTKREIGILCVRYKEGLNLEDTAKIFGVTRERIRQIEHKALRKLRHPKRARLLKYGLEARKALDTLRETREKRVTSQYVKDIYKQVMDAVDENDINALKNIQSQISTYLAVNRELTKQEELENISLDELELSVRSYNCLKRRGIHNLYELSQLTPDDLMHTRNLGRRSYEEVVERAAKFGIIFRDEEDEV